VTVDYFLNLLWLCLGVAALLAARGFSHEGEKTRFGSFRFISVVLVLAALFPYVSAMDDTLQLAQLGTSSTSIGWTRHQVADGHRANDLVWLFESMGDSVLPPAPAFVPRLTYLKFVTVPHFDELGRPSPPSLGRSPPISAPV
jgi:hypothetical protein